DLKIIIRIREKGSFASGSATLDRGFLSVMKRISEAVAKAPGRGGGAGYTDNIPISTRRFRSNWELSSARAVTVVHALLRNKAIDPERVLVEGHADTNPLVPNDTPENRAKNRRVELVIERGDDLDQGDTLPLDAGKQQGKGS
ncbi:MAG TPA: type VI secretion system protein TssL, partial [Sedimenticola sp.]|nr:type VI secretion system protein TssL [Sedimenticola sp.]